MSDLIIICVICHDRLFGSGEGEDGPVIGTRCGHMYHKRCIVTWFENYTVEMRRAPGFTWHLQVPEHLLEGNCPICHQRQHLNQCNQLYPSSIEDDSNQHKTKAEQLEKELGDTRKELGAAKEEIAGLQKICREQKNFIECSTKRINLMADQVSTLTINNSQQSQLSSEVSTTSALASRIGVRGKSNKTPLPMTMTLRSATARSNAPPATAATAAMSATRGGNGKATRGTKGARK